MFATRDHVRRHRHAISLMLDRGDWHTGGDAAEDRNVDRRLALIGLGLGKIPAYDIGAKIALGHIWTVHGGGRLGQFEDFQGPGAMGEAADEAAFFQRRDQTVHA